jgi:predicted ribosome quality control (RQC) complex YloA/Tae2 family protein
MSKYAAIRQLLELLTNTSQVIAHELSNTLVTLRVSNIYDLSSKIFLLKFAKPDHKRQIVIESGFRCHLTEYSRATASAPSPFVIRLRKYLKTRRVTAVSQVGTDRIIEFQFSDGQYRLFLEFYAGGNIILTDKDLNILALLRIVSETEGQEEQRVGLKYSLENRQNYGGIPPLTKNRLQDALQRAAERGELDLVAGKKPKKKVADALRKALAVSITEFPPMLVGHAMRVTDFESSLKPADVLQNEDLVDHLMRSLEEAHRVIQEITSSEVTKGYILATKKDSTHDKEEVSRKDLSYNDFHPFRPRQFEDDPKTVFLEFAGFNKTVDEFFSSIEGQKLESRLEEREAMAKRKIEAARLDQAKRLGGLQEVQELNERKAMALQANAERVQEAMDAVNGLIAQAMDWVEIGKLIEVEQKRQNPVASIIKLPLKLQENIITLLLGEEEFEEYADSAYETDSDVSDSEDEGLNEEPKQKAIEERLTIEINLGLSPWANAREYYDQKRSAAVKEQKTLQSSNKALKSTESKIVQDLKKGLKQEKAILRPVRRQMWFEKFTWFISSDGYLVLGGKDAQQNEILYKKYLKKGDVYLHADLHGAASIVVKNNTKTPDAPIPPSTLSQAGTLAVASSSAWDSKAGMSAWWVNADQVSKSAPTGEFLPTGSFMVRGKKNFLPPAPLLLGFGAVFLISEESKAKHVKHRLREEPVGSPIDGAAATEELVMEEVSEMDGDYASDEEDRPDADDYAQEPQANPLQTEFQAEPPTSVRNDDEMPTKEVEELEIQEETNPPPKEASSSEDEQLSPQPPTGTQTPSQTQKGTKGPAPLKRGKKGKAKKIAQKYKDQDEEDRLAATQLIGAAAGLEKAEAEAKAKAAREAELAFQKERRRAQHQTAQKETAEYEEIRKMMLDDGIDTLDDGEEEKMTSLDGLVGTPLSGDEILEAIPVCAPWAAMAKCKYKAKLQPGTMKKGKAIKEIMARWVGDVSGKGKVDESATDVERMWPREIELLKGWKVEELTGTVCVGKVRVVMAGGMAGVSGGGERSGKGTGKGGRGGKGSKKQR